MNRYFFALIGALLLVTLPLPALAFDFFGLFKGKPAPVEDERQATIAQIRETQEQLMLLQYKLRSMEIEKAQKGKAQQAQTGTGENNLQEVDQLHIKPAVSGIYTYLLFYGEENDAATQGSLEDLIRTIEKLPANANPPAIGNRFVLPVVTQQPPGVLSRRPYDFKLARTYLERLGLNNLPNGPVLVSLDEPLDPHGQEMAPAFLAVAIGQHELRRNQALIKVWHGYEKPPLSMAEHPMDDLFWQLVDGAGPTRVICNGSRLVIDLTPTNETVPPSRVP